MSAIRDGLHAHLSGDTTLTALLPDGAAGVFSDVERPSSVSLPCVQIGGDIEYSGPIDGDGMFRVTRRLLVMADRTGDQAPVDAVAAQVRNLFLPPAIDALAFVGYRDGVYLGVEGPVETDPDDDSYGRVVLVTMLLTPE